MKISFKLKNGATAAGVFKDLHDIVVASAILPGLVHVDSATSNIEGAYKPRVAYNATGFYMELANGGVVALVYNTTSLQLKVLNNFDWVALTGIVSTSTLDTANPNSTNNTSSLSLTTTASIVLNIATKSILLAGGAPFGTTATTVPYTANAFFLAVAAPVDPNRYDGVTAAKAMVVTWLGTLSDIKYTTAGGGPVLSGEGSIVAIGAQNSGSVSSIDGSTVNTSSPVVAAFPGNIISDIGGEVIQLQGRRTVGDSYEAGSRRWRVGFSGHASTSYTDFWNNSSLAVEVL